MDHEVRGVPVALQRAPAVQRPEIGVLLDRPDAGLDTRARLVQRPPVLGRLQLRELVHPVAQPARRLLQPRPALARRNPSPARLDRSCGTHGGIDGGLVAGRDGAHHVTRGRVENVDRSTGGGDAHHRGLPARGRPAQRRAQI
jgi:hypothetical protein